MKLKVGNYYRLESGSIIYIINNYVRVESGIFSDTKSTWQRIVYIDSKSGYPYGESGYQVDGDYTQFKGAVEIDKGDICD
jgi:hypothetical protein